MHFTVVRGGLVFHRTFHTTVIGALVAQMVVHVRRHHGLFAMGAGTHPGLKRASHGVLLRRGRHTFPGTTMHVVPAPGGEEKRERKRERGKEREREREGKREREREREKENRSREGIERGNRERESRETNRERQIEKYKSKETNRKRQIERDKSRKTSREVSLFDGGKYRIYGVNFLPQGYVGQHVPQHGSAGFDIDQSIGGQGLVGDGAGVVLAW